MIQFSNGLKHWKIGTFIGNCLPAGKAGKLPARLDFVHVKSGGEIGNFSKGFTLLETIIALALITAAVVGPVYLITKGLFSSAFSRNKLIANNLAQEGLEAARIVRENNVICAFLKEDSSWSWLQDSDGAGSLTGTNLKVDITQIDTITCAGKNLQNPRFSANCNESLKLNANSQYGYAAGSDTIFQRCIDVIQPGSGEGAIPASDIADVTVTLTWSERGLNKNTVVKERIYNWR